MTMVPVSEKVLEKRLQDAGGAKRLVTKVIDALERAISDYERDRRSFDDTLHDPLKPDLDVLITITEEMAALMKSDEDHEEQLLEKAEHAIGDCNDRMRALQQHTDVVNADIAKESATAANDQEKLKELQAELDENDRKIAEVRDNMKKAVTWWWVPGYNLYLLGNTLDDLIANRGPTLIDKVRDYEKEMDLTKEHLNSLRALVKVLTGEKLDMERKIEALKDSRISLERRSKVYAARIALLSDAVLYYRLLENAEGQIEENLDLPKEIEKLNESKEYVLPTGEVRRDTLKGELIHVAEEYDLYKKRLDGQLAEGVSISFKLFNISEELPQNYRLATVQEVENHRLELLKAMPSWEIANLADGSVDGTLYGGSASPNFRIDVSDKLAVET